MLLGARPPGLNEIAAVAGSIMANMPAFAAANGVRPMVEVRPMAEVNGAPLGTADLPLRYQSHDGGQEHRLCDAVHERVLLPRRIARSQ